MNVEGQHPEIRQLVDDLARPIYNYRLAVGMLAMPNEGKFKAYRKGADIRMRKAEEDILDAIDRFNENQR